MCSESFKKGLEAIRHEVKNAILEFRAEAMRYTELAQKARYDNREFDAQHYDGIAHGYHKAIVTLTTKVK